ncbi:transposase [Lacrimispora brassicae]
MGCDPVETAKCGKQLLDILKQLCNDKGIEMLKGHIMDHMHMMQDIGPETTVKWIVKKLHDSFFVMKAV